MVVIGKNVALAIKMEPHVARADVIAGFSDTANVGFRSARRWDNVPLGYARGIAIFAAVDTQRLKPI